MTSGSEVALHHAGERPEADDSKLKRDLQSPREVGPSPLSSSGGNTYMQRLQQTSVLDHLQLARPTSTATAITSRRKSTSPKRASTSLSPGSVGAVSIEKKERDKSKRLSHIPTGDDLIFNWACLFVCSWRRYLNRFDWTKASELVCHLFKTFSSERRAWIIFFLQGRKLAESWIDSEKWYHPKANSIFQKVVPVRNKYWAHKCITE